MLETSERLTAIGGLVHGFTTRQGGVSQEPYATLNVGLKWGDDPAAVRENLRRIARLAGFEPKALVRVRQVHGQTVLPASDVSRDSEADGVWCTRADGRTVSVSTADCVPVLLADRAGTVAAAVHSGWRGTVAGIVGVATASMGVEPETIVAAIGPCIEQAAFEVGPEVAAQFDPTLVEVVGGRPHVDLVGAVRAQLERAGVPAGAIERVGGCTHRNPSRYYSYRRDGTSTGQMLSFVGFAGAVAG